MGGVGAGDGANFLEGGHTTTQTMVLRLKMLARTPSSKSYAFLFVCLYYYERFVIKP